MIDLKGVYKTYWGDTPLLALNNVNLHIDEGEFVGVTGPSGSGKSTLLNVIGLLDSYDEGEYRFRGQLIKELNKEEEAIIRNHNVGFVFQRYNLISFKNVYENVELPLIYRGVPQQEREERVLNMLEKMELVGWEKHIPSHLSGGQQQRVAIARAMVMNPKIILADEPTGALDSRMTQEIVNLFRKCNEESNITIVIVTHETSISSQMNRCITMNDGRIEKDERR
ncbi:MAG: ABC transporter ATP-binding protein [Bacteroidaceae bacterium]|nr:ABC transporter ATP-binding protein [Bacteroidaceae bacterium]